MEETIRALLRNDPQVSVITDVIDWGSAEESAPYPLIILRNISSIHTHSMHGPQGLTMTRIQVDCYALSYGDVVQLARVVRRILDGYSGPGISGVFMESERDGREGGTNEAERPYFRSMDFLVSYDFSAI